MYLRMLDAMHAAGLEPNVSLKLTQFGLDFPTEACEENVAQLVERAAAFGGFVRIDMEASQYTRPDTGDRDATARPLRGLRDGDPGLSAAQSGGYRGADRRAHSRPSVQRRIS